MKPQEKPVKEFRFFIDRETTLALQKESQEDFQIEMSNDHLGTIDTLVIKAKAESEADKERIRILSLVVS